MKEWIELINEAKRQGVTKEEILKWIEEKKEEMNYGSSND